MLHHYTRAETLKLILTHRTLRFTRADLLDDRSEVPFQGKFLNPRKFFVSSWSQGARGEAGMWFRYGDYDQGVRLSLEQLRFPWTSLSVELSRESDRLKPDGTPERIGLRVRELVVPYEKTSFFGNGYIATPMVGDMRDSFGGPVSYVENPGAAVQAMVTETDNQLTFHGAGTNVVRFKGVGWADQEEYRFVLSAIKGPSLNYAADPAVYEQAALDLMAAAFDTGYGDFHPDLHHIDLPLAEDAFEGLVVTLGPAMTPEQRRTTIDDMAALMPSARVVTSALQIRPRPRR